MARLLKEGRLQIGSACADTIREFQLYRWQEGVEKDTPVKEDDHAMDDVRYFCNTIMRRKG